jgi:Fe2+ transport system protein FeoA
MTLDELCFLTARSPVDLERWAQLGAFGLRWKEPRDRGKWRHISRATAQRAVIMERLVQLGIDEEHSAAIASTHEVKDKDKPLDVTIRGVTLTVHRADLDLP